MTFQPQRRRLLAAVALFAGAPTMLRAQTQTQTQAKPNCDATVSIGGGIEALVRLRLNASGPVALVKIPVTKDNINAVGYDQPLKPLLSPGDAEDWGNIVIELERTADGKGLNPTHVRFQAAYPGWAIAGFAESAIAINTKPFNVTPPKGSMIMGGAKAELATKHYGSVHEAEFAAQLLAGTRVRLWLKENATYAKPDVQPYFAVELKSPNLKPKTGAILKAMAKVEKDSQALKCTRVGDSNCFLTTAAVHTIGLADDCWELQTLRAFRDGPLARTAEGAALSADYYLRAPRIVEAVSERSDAARVWLATYWTGVVPCAVAARLGLNRLALSMYRRMTLRLERLAAA